MIHWSISDPSAVEGDEETRLRAFRTGYKRVAPIRHTKRWGRCAGTR